MAEVNFPGADSQVFLEQIRHASPTAGLIVLTAQPQVAQAVLATKLGAVDYLEKSREVAALDALRAKIGEVIRQRTTAAQPPQAHIPKPKLPV